MGSGMTREEKKIFEVDSIADLVENNQGVVTTADIMTLGIDYRRVLALVEDGTLIRIKNGYYTTKYYDSSEEAQIAKLFPDGVLTMQTGLYYYGYLPTRPQGWHIAISKNTSKSRFNMDYPKVFPYYSEPEVLELGAIDFELEGMPIKIFSKERCICDLLKYQEKVDREDFKKAVFAYIQDESKDVVKLMEYAKERKVLKKVQSMIGVWL